MIVHKHAKDKPPHEGLEYFHKSKDENGVKVMQKKYHERTDETCCFCGSPLYTTDIDEINAECINCKAQFTLED